MSILSYASRPLDVQPTPPTWLGRQIFVQSLGMSGIMSLFKYLCYTDRTISVASRVVACLIHRRLGALRGQPPRRRRSPNDKPHTATIHKPPQLEWKGFAYVMACFTCYTSRRRSHYRQATNKYSALHTFSTLPRCAFLVPTPSTFSRERQDSSITYLDHRTSTSCLLWQHIFGSARSKAMSRPYATPSRAGTLV